MGEVLSSVGVALFDHIGELAVVVISAVVAALYRRAADRWDWVSALDAEEVVQRYARESAKRLKAQLNKGVIDDADVNKGVEKATDEVLEAASEAMRRSGVKRDTVKKWVADQIDNWL